MSTSFKICTKICWKLPLKFEIDWDPGPHSSVLAFQKNKVIFTTLIKRALTRLTHHKTKSSSQWHFSAEPKRSEFFCQHKTKRIQKKPMLSHNPHTLYYTTKALTASNNDPPANQHDQKRRQNSQHTNTPVTSKRPTQMPWKLSSTKCLEEEYPTYSHQQRPPKPVL